MGQWFDGDRYHRRNMRRGDHDYQKASAYFLTIRTHNLACLFGEASAGELNVNDAGLMLVREWHALPERFDSVTIDEFVVMPDHIHGILVITANNASLSNQNTPLINTDTSSPTLGRVLQAYKSITTRAYTAGVRDCGWLEFDAKVWQRNYYERIIRNPDERDAFRRYIRENPRRWIENSLAK